ncbi:MAG: transcriptional regulator, partial [Betaproteobacteria bacterium]|nr:transcriptional regulator [Betaproteobacteria bacterium]
MTKPKPKPEARKQAVPATAPEQEVLQEKPQAAPGADVPSPKKPARPAKAK